MNMFFHLTSHFLSRRGTHFSLTILQEVLKCSNEISVGDFGTNSFLELQHIDKIGVG